MPAEFAASGARLGLSMDVIFEQQACDQAIRPVNEPLLERPILRLSPMSKPSIIGTQGEELIAVTSGGWSQTQLEQVQKGEFALRFFLDFPEGMARNDVRLDAERIFFTDCRIWTKEALAGAEAALSRAREEADELDDEMARVRTARNEGNPIARAMAVRRSVVLADRRVVVNSKLQLAAAALPPDGVTVQEAPNGLLLSGDGRLSVKRPGSFGIGEAYHIVGTFTLSPLGLERSA